MKAAAALATDPDPKEAATRATADALAGLQGVDPGFAVLFASPHHFRDAGTVLEAVQSAAGPLPAIGCVGESVLGGRGAAGGEPACEGALVAGVGYVRAFGVPA